MTKPPLVKTNYHKIPRVEVRGAPFKVRVYVYRYLEHSRRQWCVEAQLYVRHVETGKRGWLSFYATIIRPKDSADPPPRALVIRAARHQIERALLHELDECLYVDGVRRGAKHGRG